MPENGLIAPLPENVTYEEAAPISNGAMTALLFLKKGKIKKGQKVLIYGASGSVGTFAVQLAKYFETNVTGVCSTTNIDLVKSLGADNTLDYTQKDFTKNNEVYDIIFDAVGKLSSSQCKSSLKKGGVYLNVLSLSGLRLKPEDMLFLKELMEENRLQAVIDKTYKLKTLLKHISMLIKVTKKEM